MADLGAAELATDLTGIGVQHCAERLQRIGFLAQDGLADHRVDVGGAERHLDFEAPHELLKVELIAQRLLAGRD